MAHIKGKPAEGHISGDKWYNPETNTFLIFNAKRGRWEHVPGERNKHGYSESVDMPRPGQRLLRRLSLTGQRLSGKEVVRLGQKGQNLTINDRGDLVPFTPGKNRSRSKLFVTSSPESQKAIEDMNFVQLPKAYDEELTITQMRNLRKKGRANNPKALQEQILASRKQGNSLLVDARTKILEEDYNLVEDPSNEGTWITKGSTEIASARANIGSSSSSQELPKSSPIEPKTPIYQKGFEASGKVSPSVANRETAPIETGWSTVHTIDPKTGEAVDVMTRAQRKKFEKANANNKLAIGSQGWQGSTPGGLERALQAEKRRKRLKVGEFASLPGG